jgi:2-amino-4-hydroxy-6-hydroxymethyldihydropteridine diphosphokinase
VDRPRARVFLGIGSSLQPEENLRGALRLLAGTPGLEILGISTLYRTPPLPPPGVSPTHPTDDPDFLNGVLEIRTGLSPKELEVVLTRVEDALGRIRSPDNYAPRTMDLDILLFLPESSSGGTSTDPGQYPAHPDIRTRAFVAHPLLELDPDIHLPPDGRSLREVAAGFPDAGGVADLTLTARLRGDLFGS